MIKREDENEIKRNKSNSKKELVFKIQLMNQHKE